MKKLFLSILFVFCYIFVVEAHSRTTTLNVLVPMRVLDVKLIEKFEKTHNCQINVEFITNYKGYESYLRSETQIFDVVIADEKSLIQITTANLLRTLPEELRQAENSTTQLQVKTPFNTEVNTYTPLFVNPMGIAYNSKISHISEQSTWDILIDPDKNPYWRQRISFMNDKSKQIALALLAVHEPLTNSKKLPPNTAKWLSQLRAQHSLINEPLELAFLSNNVNAAVLFYSDFIRYKNIIPNLNFFIPYNGTYFDRFGIGWCLSSVQENLAKKFIAFMISNSEKFSNSNQLFDINAGSKERSSQFNSWVLYDESSVLPFLPSPVSGQ